MEDKEKKKAKFYIGGGILAFSLVLILCLAYAPMSPWYQWWVDDEEAPTPGKALSTFGTVSNVDREVVSSFTKMDIWAPKTGVIFESYGDITDIATNFERIKTNADADDISIDLRIYEYIWAEIVGNSVWANTFHLYSGGINRDYEIEVHHTSSALPFNIYVKGSGAAITIPGHQTNGNFTGVFDVPIDSRDPDACHYGDYWALSTTEFAELTQTGKEFYWDESNWCDQYPTYDPTLDTSNEYERDFEKITNAPVLRFTMNDTISVVDGEATQLNVSIAKGYPIDTLISGTYLYMAWYAGFDFLDGPYTFNFEMWFGVNLNITTVQTGRGDFPSTLSSLTNFVAYNTIGVAA